MMRGNKNPELSSQPGRIHRKQAGYGRASRWRADREEAKQA